ncbi:MAG: hypothetical protein IJ401_01565 [Oscillospiraceae bacterium]|nr:hypothetical protein [Oscillospiraceae bacterium]
MRNDFRKSQLPSSDNWYDLEFDKDLIKQSIAKQYHILPSEQEELHYSDWLNLVAGLMDDTPLGRVVQIRCENDKDVIANYTNHEKKIRSEWISFRDSQIQKNYTEKEKIDVAAYFEKLFTDMLGGGV